MKMKTDPDDISVWNDDRNISWVNDDGNISWVNSELLTPDVKIKIEMDLDDNLSGYSGLRNYCC